MHAPLILDIAGLSLQAHDVRRLSHPLCAGLVLFARNFQSREQLTALCASIKSVRPDLLILVDHEGGRVQRFKTDGFTHLPAMRTLGSLWMRDPDPMQGAGPLRASDLATACGYVLAAELRACGVDMSFTPVLDLDYTQGGASTSRVIADRAFHADAPVVAMLAKALIQGLSMAGMASCGKHFPGHGFVAADSHVAMPIDPRDLGAIVQADAAPYRWLATVLDSVMPAHVVYPRVDARAAGFSKRWLQDILRGQLGFLGAIFSDDLAMAGARCIDGRAVSFAQAACAALDAGCDLVLLCNQSVEEGDALDALLAGLSVSKERDWQPFALSEARRRALLPKTPPLSWDALMGQARYQRCLQVIASSRGS